VRTAAKALRAAVLGAALALLPCCGQRPAADVEPSALEQVTPAERGWLRARADIAAGKLRMYRYGNPASFSNPRTDSESGLPVRTLLDCCITAEAREETEAYNRVMRETAAARRPVSP
jgi:hypothetical protein